MRATDIETNNPERWTEIALAMAIVIDAITFFNAWKHGKRLRKTRSAKPIVWGHVDLMGRYPAMKCRFTPKNRLLFLNYCTKTSLWPTRLIQNGGVPSGLGMLH